MYVPGGGTCGNKKQAAARFIKPDCGFSVLTMLAITLLMINFIIVLLKVSFTANIVTVDLQY